MRNATRHPSQTVRFGTKTINFRMFADDHMRIKDAAAEKGVTMQELILQACDLVLKEHEGKGAERVLRPTEVLYGK